MELKRNCSSRGWCDSFSAEHGGGRLKRETLARTKDPASLGLMRHIKAAVDPNGVMNTGNPL
ncbi:MAG TPA: FAD-linked oxidase C-terminal domain-containing protein [Roseiarcus sp.]|nr:FAD-linked oxidase C-terminal domain-containing protein [Roseiarcus sp.]